jgi:hypothetical protein
LYRFAGSIAFCIEMGLVFRETTSFVSGLVFVVRVALVASVSVLLVGTTFTKPDEKDASQSLLFARVRLAFVDNGKTGGWWRTIGV